MSDRDRIGGTGNTGRATLGRILLGFAIALFLVYVLGAVIGWDEAIAQLRTASPRWIAIACLSTLLCLATWAKTWQIVIRTVGVSVPYRKLVVTFLAATFANYVTPMGQAGGEPFIAYVLSRDTEATYEQSLASVVTADLIRMLPFFTVGGVGLGYLLVSNRFVESIEGFAVLLVGLAVAIPIVMILAWRERERLRSIVLEILGPIAKRTGRFSIESARDRIDRLYGSIEVIAESPRALLAATGFAYLGWVLFALPLYFSGLALDVPISLLLVCFVVPVSVIAGSTPLPGGLGAIEGTVVALLVALTAITSGEALAVTTLYRLTSYWLVIAVGGLAALWVLKRT